MSSHNAASTSTANPSTDSTSPDLAPIVPAGGIATIYRDRNTIPEWEKSLPCYSCEKYDRGDFVGKDGKNNCLSVCQAGSDSFGRSVEFSVNLVGCIVSKVVIGPFYILWKGLCATVNCAGNCCEIANKHVSAAIMKM
jgi:hypothetical protein